jgi:hypothetical protein
MSLGSKLKDFFTKGGCVIDFPRDTTKIETILDALEVIRSIRCSNSQDAQRKTTALLEQVVGWVDILQQDMNIVKAVKLRTILHDIAEIKIQLISMANDISTLKYPPSSEYDVLPETVLIKKIKDTIKNVKTTKEKKDGNK